MTSDGLLRILHFADVHIGVENYSRTDPLTGLSTRLSDFLDTYDEVVEYALDNNVDLALFCGDAYKSRDPSQTHQREFAKRVARLTSGGVSVFLLLGNHDMPHVIGRATALEIFQTLTVPRVVIGDTPKTYRVDTAAGPVQIVAMPWIRRSAFLARDETRGLAHDQINEAIQERLARIIRTNADALDPSLPAVFAGHVSVSDARTGSEQSMMLGRDHVLVKSSVALPEFDYVALGHIHRHQVLEQDPYMAYSGSLQRIDFGEEGDEKGFCVVDVDTGGPRGQRLRRFEFRHVNARRLLTIPVQVDEGDPDPTATVVQAIRGHEVDGAIVRVQISLPRDLEGYLREREIRDTLEEAHLVASVSKEFVGQPRARLGQAYTKGLDPKEALKAYLETRDISQERAEVLIRHAERLMEEQPAE